MEGAEASGDADRGTKLENLQSSGHYTFNIAH